MRRKRKKRFIYRKGAPVITLCMMVILCSATMLVVMEKTGGISFKMDEMNYVYGAISANAYNIEENEEEEISGNLVGEIAEEGLSEGNNNNEETGYSENIEDDENADEKNKKETKKKGLLKLLLCTALSYNEADENVDSDFNVVVSAENENGIKVISSDVEENAYNGVVEAQQISTPVVSDIQGAVFIYHTHSTESYEPYSDGNYHITGSQGTVRNVANCLTEVLESKGIKVYHDTTLHDNPSYTNSYGRSLNTAQNYLSQYSDISVMIDLHRDAMATGGSKYNTIEVNGGRATSFNIVVGRQNNNYSELMNFANLVISKANELYPGLGGRVIEREYKFNEFLSNHYILAEVGNNGNSIEEAEMTGRLLGDVIEAVMREM